MIKGTEKLAQDALILTEMAGEMVDYLRSDALFWQMMRGGMPKLTLGGYLMRQHRLLALRDLLSAEDREKADTAVTQFNQTLVEQIVRLEQKAHRELEARIRQWSEYLKDSQSGPAAAANYRSAVETRAMMTAVTEKLSLPPYRLESRIKEQIALLDGNLRQRWQTGPFIWPEEWEPAYPQAEYWFLYGRLR
ncbi:MAG: hypothetical protein GY803_22045 [Chloroflexi bacterium]|nr:hypothetical protein [Chloroflexota bacterium]